MKSSTYTPSEEFITIYPTAVRPPNMGKEAVNERIPEIRLSIALPPYLKISSIALTCSY